MAGAEASARAAVAGAKALGDDALLAEALAQLATVELALGRGPVAAELIERAVQLERPEVRTASMLRPSLVAAVMHLWNGHVSDGAALLRTLLVRHDGRGEEF